MKRDDLPTAPGNLDASAPAAPVDAPRMALGAWSFYFLAKLMLVWRDLIGFHALENLGFAAFLLLPLRSPRLRRARKLAAVPLGIALLYYDSWLPPLARVLSQAALVSSFSSNYLLDLAGRFLHWPTLAALGVAFLLYLIADRYLRVGVLVLAALLVQALMPALQRKDGTGGSEAVVASASSPAALGNAGNAGNPDELLQAFHAAESQRRVNFPRAADDKPFDIIILQICSLSWDDLQMAGLDKHPLWSSFDFLFTHFNSAASYSGPAAIRINRATCGQQSHQALYQAAPEGCYLMPALKQAGFEPNFAMNHDGRFDEFLAQVKAQGLSAPLMPINGLPAPLRGFDNLPIYDDYGVLARWFDQRRQSEAQRVALFYNTISLHDGNKVVSGPGANQGSRDSYKPRLEKLLNDLNAFMDQIRASGRRAVVVVVPEHGAALRGDKFQIAGLREIPTPLVTRVPVGIRVIGPDAQRRDGAARIDESVSYLAMSHILAGLVRNSPYGSNGFAATDYLESLPSTPFVAENEASAMIERGGRYLMKQGAGEWKEYGRVEP
ncbi:cellulose synthase operon protein YhjU [Noviherbaspirillum humi]|uniref:Cellulose synthase operon protein YhjU n=1 Tax=Noviherbaspirillum humi TaxID=1688639 RepID=A0A239HLD5_9BURK|nr:cellulose biosynthesis protein BcsG [Noviherbaspirillum humi]SNS82216.1 cellulose synthase operon protein YhjU [Noviherbaspirillum humi]